MSSLTLIVLGSSAEAGAGLVAGRIGFSVVSVVFYTLTVSGVPADAAARRQNIPGRHPAGIDRLVCGLGKIDVGFLVVPGDRRSLPVWWAYPPRSSSPPTRAGLEAGVGRATIGAEMPSLCRSRWVCADRALPHPGG
jgi:hypothetical protein